MEITLESTSKNVTKIIGLVGIVTDMVILAGPETANVSDKPDYDCIFIHSGNWDTPNCSYQFARSGDHIWCDQDSEFNDLTHDDIFIGFNYNGKYYTAKLSNGNISAILHDEAAKIELVDSIESFQSVA